MERVNKLLVRINRVIVGGVLSFPHRCMVNSRCYKGKQIWIEITERNIHWKVAYSLVYLLWLGHPNWDAKNYGQHFWWLKDPWLVTMVVRVDLSVTNNNVGKGTATMVMSRVTTTMMSRPASQQYENELWHWQIESNKGDRFRVPDKENQWLQCLQALS